MTAAVEQNHSRTYFLDLKYRRNCAAIESAKPRKPINVLVRPEEDRSEPNIVGTGLLSADGKVFHVFVAGEHSHDWTWDVLKVNLR